MIKPHLPLNLYSSVAPVNRKIYLTGDISTTAKQIIHGYKNPLDDSLDGAFRWL
ncbi:hypothetical protein D3C86_1994080 [compost metagenome]